MKKISILGSTGSVGQNTIKVIQAQMPESLYEIQALTANNNVTLLAEQAVSLNARLAVIADETLYGDLKNALAGTNVKAAAGEQGLIEAALMPADWIMAAIVGMAGLKPLMAAISQGTCVAIANKEPLVAAGALVIEKAREHRTKLLPIDSEHNAVFQVLEPHNKSALEKIILTASGGPFLNMPLEQMVNISPEQALRHPNWNMGNKISIDSATMMNKALEIIEAHWLFDLSGDKIDVVVHPQSIVHSMVQYSDGSVLAQLGAADMSTPITYALGWPSRLSTPGEKIDIQKLSILEFKPVDHSRFPFIGLAYRCLSEGTGACVAMNATNEVAVQAFLDHKIAFLDIYDIVSGIVDSLLPISKISTLEDILDFDCYVRSETKSCIIGDDSKSTAVV